MTRQNLLLLGLCLRTWPQRLLRGSPGAPPCGRPSDCTDQAKLLLSSVGKSQPRRFFRGPLHQQGSSFGLILGPAARHWPPLCCK